MEGSWRAIAAMLLACAPLAAAGCGEDSGDASADSPAVVRTNEPGRTFAPLVELPADERYRPMGARWFIERSVLRFADDEGCPDRTIAVGRTLPEQRSFVVDWIFPNGLAKGSTYYRNPLDASCEYNLDWRFYASDLTRPHDPGPRVEGIRPGEGFYLDLVDSARGGPSYAVMPVPVYVERRDEGDGGVRLTYWMLYGMHAPGDGAATREGDWERVDVLLQDEGDGVYAPLGVQLDAEARNPREVSWQAVPRVGGTHPMVASAPGDHALSLAGDDGRCRGCVRWETWQALSDARDRPWYGFGGAWGEPGESSATTGPLGPHGYWPVREER
jgi:hypothetical protein